jgi:hypothetical protein
MSRFISRLSRPFDAENRLRIRRGIAFSLMIYDCYPGFSGKIEKQHGMKESTVKRDW